MVAKVKLAYTVTLTIKAESEEQLSDWMNEHTPAEAEKIAEQYGGQPVSEYEDEILEYDTQKVDLDLTEKTKSWNEMVESRESSAEKEKLPWDDEPVSKKYAKSALPWE